MGNFLYTVTSEYGFMLKPLQEGGTLNTVLVCLAFVAIILCAYLLGSVNFAIIISGKKYKDDIRSHGSKNAGMTNMMRTYGKGAAALTLGGDALKAVISCIIGYLVMGQFGAYAAGLFCMLGHVFPLYYGFKGGKGVVTAAATVLMTDPIVFLILITALLCFVGQLGDLVFSSIKRYYEIKDFSDLIPGHGGILDRFDSLIFVTLTFVILVGRIL